MSTSGAPSGSSDRAVTPEDAVSLERSLSRSQLIFYGVGTILGLGIYVLLGEVAGAAGHLAPFSFLVAAVVAAFTGLSYGELAARIPKSAGEVNYVDEAFGRRALSALVGWLIVASAIVSTATVMNGYVGYVDVFVTLPDPVVIAGMTLLLSGVAAWGIKESAATITIITLIELAGIAVVVAIAGDNLAGFPDRWREMVPAFTMADWERVLLGSFLAFFAFIGFEDMVNVAEEARDPGRDLPVAIIVSLGVLTVLYVVVAAIGDLALPRDELAGSEAPLATILRQEGEQYPHIISAISLVAIVNGVLVQIVMSARVLYGMARKGMAPALLARVNPTTRTPLWSTAMTGGVVLLLALAFELGALAKATNFILLVVFVLVNLSLWVIKRREAPPEGVRPVPLAVPVLGVVLSLGVLLFQAAASLGAAGGH